MAVIVMFMLGLGLYLEYSNSLNPNMRELITLHKSFGIITGVFILFRILVRNISDIPAYSAGITPWEIKTARLTHVLIYALVLIMVVSGYVMSDAGGHGIQFFGYDIPHLLELNKPLAKICRLLHKLAAYLLIALLSLHVLAVIKHYFIDKINLLTRII